jgi:LAS superfamily LD-carboxypeptidase LdcB
MLMEATPMKRIISIFTVFTLIAGLMLTYPAIPVTGEGSSVFAASSSSLDKMKALYYYESARKTRYVKYQKAHPKLSYANVVWMVDADLDLTFYDDSHKAKNIKTLTVLVNKYNKLPAKYKPKKLVSVGRTQLKPEAAKAFKKMQKAAKKANRSFIAQSGYRSYSTQKYIYNRNKSKDPGYVDIYSARPAYSEHQTGLAIDVNKSVSNLNNFTGTAAAAWVSKNAYKYGFIVRYTEENKKWTGYKSEPWHLRYIGVSNSKKMKAAKCRCYEEYWVKYIKHTPPEPE